MARLGKNGVDWEGMALHDHPRYQMIRRVLESELDDMNGIETIGMVESVHRRWGKPIEYSSPEEECDRSSLREVTKEVLSSTELTSNERSVLKKRVMAGRTLREVADKMKFKSSERIRQIEAKALRKLRHPEVSKYLKEFV